MMKKYKIMLAVLVPAFFCLSASARQQWEMAPRHSVEISSGASFGVFRYKGESGSSLGAAIGENSTLRYTYFFQNGWGAFASLSAETVSADETAFFGAVNKADAGKYLYRFTGYSVFSPSIEPLVSVGAAYRWTKGKFTLIPRLAVGVGDYYGSEFSFERRDRDGKLGPEYISVDIVCKSETVDYLINANYYESIPPVMFFSGSFQVSCKLGRRMNLFVEPVVNAAPGRIHASLTTVKSKNDYAPANWVEAVAYYEAKDRWVIDPDSSVSKDVLLGVPVFFHLNVGLGINFGR